MKTSSLVRFVCISFAWYSVEAGYVKARAEVPTGDDPIQVRTLLGIRGPGIAGCFASAPSYKVRFQSLKTSNGSEYSRQLVTTADLPCFTKSANKILPAATNIVTCAEATANEGLNSSLWEGGACTAYLAWRPRTRAGCREGGSKVVYVVRTPLKPFSGGELVTTGAIRYGVPQTYVDIGTRYDTCGFGTALSKGYKLRWNDTQELTLPEGTTAHSMDYKVLCSGSMNLSLWSLDAGGKVNTNGVNLTIDKDLNRWYGLQTGGCLYLSPTSKTYSGSINDCRSWGLPTLFFEKVDGEAAAFLRALNAPNAYGFFVGLQYVGNSWTWMEGLVQPTSDTEVWGSPPVQPDNLKCVEVSNEVGGRKLANVACYINKRFACYYSII